MNTIEDRLNASLSGRYQIEKQIGSGGMAAVFRALDLKHNRQVALKVLHPELATIVGAERFLSEIRTTATLQHPHILPMHDSGEADGLLFYVMPLVDGETLRERLLREHQLPIDDAVQIAKQVAGALGYAHRHGVIHRDVKPENIVLHDGQALIADFGIALAVASDDATRITQTGLALGTPQYMSPEQAIGERSITPKADLYALGCVLYEMLTGQPPFTGATVQAIVTKVLQERPAAPSSIRASIPTSVDEAVVAALAKLPADRIRSAAAFVDALSEGSKSHVSPAPMRELVATSGGSTQWRLVSAVLAVIAVAGWTAAFRSGGVKYLGPKGCEAQDGVWRHVRAGEAGMWITHNGYGLEVVYRNGAKAPETSSWRLMKCTDTSTTAVYLDSTLTSPDAAALQTGAEITGPLRIEEGVMVWRNPGKDRSLGEERRGERIR